MAITNQGKLYLNDLKKQVVRSLDFKYPVCCVKMSTIGCTLLIGFGYNWDQGMQGLQNVDYQSELAYFDLEEFYNDKFNSVV